MVTVTALIPARSGSTRLKDKNVLEIGGHPLIAYAITSALESKLFERVIVSTDSEDYARIANHYGASTPHMRPAKYARSNIADISWAADLQHYLDEHGFATDALAILRPTNPFRTADTIKRAWGRFDEGCDSVRAVEQVSRHPGKMWVVGRSHMHPLLPFNESAHPWHSSPTQFLPAVYAQNGCIEIVWSDVIRNGTLAGDKIRPFYTEGYEGFDINTEDDWGFAEWLVASGRAQLPTVTKPAAKAA